MQKMSRKERYIVQTFAIYRNIFAAYSPELIADGEGMGVTGKLILGDALD
jgi:hypothetical protein